MSGAVKYPVNGEWMTVRQLAERFGVTATTVYKYRVNHRGPDGRPLPLQDVYDHYAAVERGDLPRYPGRIARKRPCAGRRMTVSEAADMLKVRPSTLSDIMYRYRCDLDAACRIVRARQAYEQQIRAVMAEREILGILGGAL